MEAIRRILVAFDLEREEAPSLETALRFAQAFGASLTLLHVVRIDASTAAMADPPLSESVARWLHQSADRRLAAMAARAAVLGVAAEVLVLDGRPTEGILEAIREVRADLAVLETHGRSGPMRFLLGSVATNVAAAAPCPVVTVGRRVPRERQSPSVAAGAAATA